MNAHFTLGFFSGIFFAVAIFISAVSSIPECGELVRQTICMERKE